MSDLSLRIPYPFEGKFPITYRFGEKSHSEYVTLNQRLFGVDAHDGVDFALPAGTSVYTVGSGTVLSAGEGMYGTTVAVKHTWGTSYYGHLSSVRVVKGDIVPMGTEIGLSGESGIATGPHLHFGIQPNNPKYANGYHGMIDPIPYLEGSILGVRSEKSQRAELFTLPKGIYKGTDNQLVTTLTSDGKDYTFRLRSPRGTEMEVFPEIYSTGTGYTAVITKPREFMPGSYILTVTTPEGQFDEQEFSWGVLAINTHQSIYRRGTEARIAMAVLDGRGEMVCDASLTLEISDPAGGSTVLTTENNEIVVNEEVCSTKNLTISPDYQGLYKTEEPGRHTLTLTAFTSQGSYTITDSFMVEEEPAYELERLTATRIYPGNIYPVIFRLKANVSGPITFKEIVPAALDIHTLSHEDIKKWVPYAEDQEIQSQSSAPNWSFSGESGKTYYFGYSYDGPDVSPAFYTLGPASIGGWHEARQWQIAVDAIDPVVGYISPPATWTAVGDANLVLPHPDPRNGDLMIAAMAVRPSSVTIATPAGWTLVESRTGTDGAAEGVDTGSVGVYIFTKVADGTEGITTQTFTKTGTASVISGQISLARSATGTYSVSGSGFSINADATAWSGTLASDIGLTHGDVVMLFAAQNGDLSNTTTFNITATNINAKSTVNEHGEYATTTGNDLEVGVALTQIWDGTNTATPTISVTQSAAASGVMSAVRIRQGSGTPRTDTWVRSASRQSAGTTSVNATFPEHDPGDLLVMMVGSRGSTAPTPTTPAGWTSINSFSGGPGTFGADAGPARMTMFYRQAEDRYTGTLAVAIASGDTAIVQIIAVSRSQIGSWSIDSDGGSDTSAGTGWSVTGGGLDFSNADGGDLVLVGSASNSDAYTYTSYGLSASGITFSDVTETTEFISSTGNDMALTVSQARVSAGSGTGIAPTATMTSSGSAANAPGGSTIILTINGNTESDPSPTVGYFAPGFNTLTFGDASIVLPQPNPENGDLMLVTIAIRPSASTVNTPGGWTLLDSRSGTDGAAEGADTGSVGLYTFYKVADGTEGSANVTFTETGTTSVSVATISKARSATGTYSLSAGGYSKNADTTNWSTTLDTDIGMTQGDLILVSAAQNGDLSNTSAWDIQAAGVTLKSTPIEQGEFSSTQGNDLELDVMSTMVWEGTNTATPETQLTHSAAVSGTAVAVRVRQGSGTARSDTWIRSAGIMASGTTSIAFAYPEHDVGDLMVLMVASRGSTDPTITTPTGWTSLGTYNGGAGSFAADAGNARITAFYREVDYRRFGGFVINIASGDITAGQVLVIHKDNLTTWSIDTDGGTDTSAGTAWSVTGSGIDLASANGGDIILVGTSINTDANTYTSHGLSASGITFSSVAESAGLASATGNDIRLEIAEGRVTSGSGTGAAVTYTLTSSGFQTNSPAGSSMFIKILGNSVATISIGGSANGNNGATVKVAVNGSAQAQTATIASSVWSITGVTQPSTNDVVTVWVDNVSDANESTGVTKYSGSGDIAGMVLDTNVMTVGSDQDASLTVTNLNTYDCTEDEDVMHQAAGSHLKTEGDACAGSTTNSYTEEIEILSGDTLTVGGSETMSAYDVTVTGTLTSSGSATYNIEHNWTKTGTFTASTSTVNLTGAGATTQTLSGTTSFNNLSATGSSARTVKFPSSVTTTVTGTLTLSGASSQLLTLDPGTASTVWTINPSAASVSYVSVSYSTNSGVTFCAANSTDGGNNSGWNISIGSTCTSPTSYSFQRKTWHDGTRYWRSYRDIANSRIRFDYSTDGSSWTEDTSARINTDTNDFSVHADSSNAYIAYKTTSVTHEDNLVPQGLVAYWKMNEVNWTSNLITDSTGNGHTGTAVGDATTTTGKFNNGGTFDGAGDYYTVDDHANLRPGTGSWTMAQWINPENVAQGRIISGKLNMTSGAGYGFGIFGSLLGATGKKITWGCREAYSGDRVIGITNSDVVDGNWHHIAGVCDAGTQEVRIYVDGVEVAVTTDNAGSYPDVTNTDTFIVGRGDSSTQYVGLMDDLRVYNRVLTDEEIAQLGQPGYDIEVRKASSYPGTGFSWGVESIAHNGASGTDVFSYAAITQDTASKVWVAGSRNNGGTYTFNARQSTSANDITAWNANTALDSSANANKYGVIVPRTSGNMQAIWIDNAAIESKNYTSGTWDGSPTSIDTGINTITRSLSAVSDSSGNVHLLYVDDEATDRVSSRMYNGSSWGSAALVPDAADADDAYPSLTFDSTDSKLYAFWIDTATGDISYSSCAISTSCDTESEWSSENVWQTSGANTDISSVYTHASYAFAEWHDGSNVQWARIALNLSEFSFQTGYYIGSGTDNRAISGLGFQPDAVLLKDDTGNGSDGVNFKTSVMSGETSSVFVDPDADTASDAIQSLDTDGFTLGTDVDVNAENIRFTWMAIDGSNCSATGTFCVGSYTGDNQSSHAITSVGFKPDLIIIKSSSSQAAVFRTSDMADNVTQFFSASNEDTGGTYIKTLDSTGFTVGGSNQVNGNGINFWYIALKKSDGIFDVGTFTGDGNDGKTVTEPGFEPNSVWIKNSNATSPVTSYYNNTDSQGNYSTSVADNANASGVIKSLDPTGFTLGTDPAGNESGKTLYWFAFAGAADPAPSGTFTMSYGTYTGNGTSQSISGLSFAPDLVIVKTESGAAYTVYRTRMMKGDTTAYFTVTDPFFAGGITSLNSDGFTVGSDANVNTSSTVYHYQAFGNAYNPETGTGAADFTIGAYTGNALDNRDIRRLPFQPDLVSLKRNSSTDAVFRIADMAGDITSEFGSSGDAADTIQAINTDGFQVGAATKANGNGIPIYFFAFKEGPNFKVGEYTGTGTAQDITDPGIQPDLVWVKSSSTGDGIHRPASLAGNSTHYFTNTAAGTNRITALISNGFSVTGTSGDVNANGTTYRYVVWKETSANTDPDSPTSLAQLTAADVTITTGGWHNATSVKFTASADDADSSDTLYLCVEKDDVDTAFSGTEDSCGTGVAFSGTPVTVSVTISSQTDATSYHWRARVKDAAGAYSSWVSYGGNSDTTPGADRDYGLDTTAPTGGTVYDGTTVGVDTTFSTSSLSQLSANWDSFNSNVSGLNKYQYSIGTTVGGTDIKNWTDNSTTASVTATGLTLQTNTLYYFNVRAVDNAGNTQSPVISSNGQIVAPSISFTVSPGTLTFLNLNAGNSYTDAQDTTLTTSTNAYGGYVIRSFVADFLRSTDAATTIGDFTGGTYASPAVWGSSTGFGYTSSDSSVQGSDKFGSGTLYAPFSHTGPGDIVADHASGVTGVAVTNEQFTITSKVQTSATQAAKRYGTTVVYSATAQY